MSHESFKSDYQASHDSLEDEAGLQLKMPIHTREEGSANKYVIVGISLTSRLVDLIQGPHIVLNTGSTRESYVMSRLRDEIVIGEIVRRCIRISLMSRTRSGDTQYPRKG